MRLHALLPAKENFTANHAGAVAMVVQDFLAHSAYRADAKIFGKKLVDMPLDGAIYQPIESWHRFVYGRNKGLAAGYIRMVNKLPKDKRPQLIEVHGRCAVASIIARALPDIPVMLVLHNDPREMDGARSVAERQKLARDVAAISAVSHYLLDCFQDGLDKQQLSDCGFFLTPFGMDRLYQELPQKQKQILFVGRIVPEKGVLEAAEAIAHCLPEFPDWQFKLIGARRFVSGKSTPYQNSVESALASLGEQASFLGHLPLSEVRKHQAEAAIILVPSQFQEPAGRVILEAFAAGAALVASRKGGIPEYAGDDALILDRPDSEHILEVLQNLLSDKKALARWQKRAFGHISLSLDEAAVLMDKTRRSVVDSF